MKFGENVESEEYNDKGDTSTVVIILAFCDITSRKKWARLSRPVKLETIYYIRPILFSFLCLSFFNESIVF